MWKMYFTKNEAIFYKDRLERLLDTFFKSCQNSGKIFKPKGTVCRGAILEKKVNAFLDHPNID